MQTMPLSAVSLKLVILCSGSGSNLRAIHKAITEEVLQATIVAVISDKADAKAIAFARDQGLETAVVSPNAFANRAHWDVALASAVASFAPNVVVLAGFMRIIGAPLLAQFGGRVINVHPALLPSFPGTHGAQQAIDYGVRIAGCTVHVVDAGVDTGPILAQGALAVRTADAAILQTELQKLEHTLLPRVLQCIAQGEISLGTPDAPEPVVVPSALHKLALLTTTEST